MALKSAEAQPLLNSLRELLAIAGKLNVNEPFDYRVAEIPHAIGDLRPFLSKHRKRKVLFWRLVKELDRKVRNLKIEQSLNALYARWTLLEPGPLTKLMVNRASPHTAQDHQELCESLAAHMEREPNQVPKNLARYEPLLVKVPSTLFQQLLSGLSSAPIAREKHALTIIRWLDFYWQHRSWRDRYEKPLVCLWELAEELQHQPLMDKIDPFLYGERWGVDYWRREHKKEQARLRKRRSRARKQLQGILTAPRHPAARDAAREARKKSRN
jgi:hypothetical protein